MPLTPDGLDRMERMAAAYYSTWSCNTVLDLIAEIRRLTAERDAARECVARTDERAEAHEGHAHHLEGVVVALATENAALREALGDLLDYQANALLQTLDGGWKQAIIQCRAALAAPTTAYTALAAARAEVVAAERAFEPHPVSWKAAIAQREAAYAALAEAEKAAGVSGS